MIGKNRADWLTRGVPNSQNMAPAADCEQVLKLAFEMNNMGRHEEAEALCRVLLRLDPSDGQVLFLLGMARHKLGHAGEALEYLERAARLQPQSARIFNALGFVHLSLKDPARAVANYDRAIALGMSAANLYYSLGNAYYQLGQIERAAEIFQRAVDLKPRDVECLNNLAKCLCDLGRLDESIEVYNRALEIDPKYPMARYGRSMALLGAGRLREGFQEYNLWRHHGRAPRTFAEPAWNGEPMPGGTLFFYAEQGFGDAFMHARFVKLARERVGRVILECRPELKIYFKYCGLADEVIAHGEKIPPFDKVTSMVSLAGILGITLETIPNEVPYLKAGEGAPLPAAPAGNLRAGLVWSGNPEHHNDAARSMRLEMLQPLLAARGVTFYSLQKEVRAVDEAAYREARLVDLGGRLGNFLETSAVLAQLDVVIAVDTAVAHLAGALSKPVWLLLAFSSDWRWLRNRADTPWYPTMRLFRQSQRNQWGPVVAKVAEELEARKNLMKGSRN